MGPIPTLSSQLDQYTNQNREFESTSSQIAILIDICAEEKLIKQFCTRIRTVDYDLGELQQN